MANNGGLVNTLMDALISLAKCYDGDPENAEKICQIFLDDPENVKTAKIVGELFFWYYFSRIRCQQRLRRPRR